MFIVALPEIAVLIREATQHVNAKAFRYSVFNFRLGKNPTHVNNFQKGRVLAALHMLDQRAKAYFENNPQIMGCTIPIPMITGPLQPLPSDVVRSFPEQLPLVFKHERNLRLAEMMVTQMIDKNCIVTVVQTIGCKELLREESRRRYHQETAAREHERELIPETVEA
jgi:hypothetical protein